MKVVHLVCVAAAFFACGETPAPPPATANTPTVASANASAGTSAHGLAIVPLKLVANATGATKYGFKTIELRADGSMLLDDKPWAKLTPDHVESAGDSGPKSGTVLAKIGPDGTVTGDHEQTARFTPSESLANAEGEAFTIADDGTVTFTRASGEKINVDAKFESMPAEGKRAGLMVIATSRIGYFIFKRPNKS
jgi:hypothetical protein